MKNIAPCLFVMFILCVNNTITSQNEFATIEKNRNQRASSLYHNLNITKDTLILKSDKKINSAYVIDPDDALKKTEFYIDGNDYKIPLTQFKKGRHVFVAVQSPLEIVFVVNILQDISKLQLKSFKSLLNEREPVVGTDEIEN